MRPIARPGIAALTGVTAVALGGCGGEAWQPAGVGPDNPASALPLEGEAAASFDGDRVEPVGGGGPSGVDAPVGGAPDGASASADGAPHVVWLLYGDGKPGPSGICPSASGVPAFKCMFGADLLECQKKVQGFLDKMYADFNVVFTVRKPTSGTYATSVIVTSDGSWCGRPGYLGLAPAGCGYDPGAVSYAFACTEARKCATTIAQEHAHTVGLDHTDSQDDVLIPSWPCNCPGFEDKTNKTQMGSCGGTQNSYQLMKTRLGAWTGGEKPGPFSSCTDMAAPAVSISEPKDGAHVGSSFTVSAAGMDDCGLKGAHIDVAPWGVSDDEPTGGPYTWDLTKVPAGKQTITVTVTDGSGKTATTKVAVTVGSGGGGSGGGGNGGSGGGGDGGSGGSPSATGGCSQGGAPAGSLLAHLALLALLALALRSRVSCRTADKQGAGKP